jgi:hypothetical protein
VLLQEGESCGDEGILQGCVEVMLLDELDEELEGLVFKLEVVNRGCLGDMLADRQFVLND